MIQPKMSPRFGFPRRPRVGQSFSGDLRASVAFPVIGRRRRNRSGKKSVKDVSLVAKEVWVGDRRSCGGGESVKTSLITEGPLRRDARSN